MKPGTATTPEMPTPPAEAGPLTELLEEVFREAGPDRSAWVEGLSAGASLGRYDLIREVGRGGMAVVWEARDRELGRRVAVKVMRAPASGSPGRRVLAEAEVAARLSHPGIATILDVGRGEHGAWLVQEFLDGETLAARLARGPMALAEALDVSIAIARALAHAHAHGVVHRDLTARNVFLCADGPVKLLDLGIAQAFGRRKLEGGSLDAMAPEQLSGAPEDERTDVYALGTLLFQMLTGVTPAAAGSGAARGLATPEAPALGALVEAMRARDPLERPRDAGAVAEALEEIRAGLPRTVGTKAGTSRVRPPPRARWMLGGAGLAALLVGIPLAAWLATRRPPPPSNVVFAASSAFTPCRWEASTYVDLESLPAGAVTRNGKLHGQEPALRDGRKVWLQRSDWNNLFIPLKERPDVFAVEAWAYVPAVDDGPRGATLTVMTDPDGPDPGHLRHGRSVGIAREPGKAPFFRYGLAGGPDRTLTLLTGALPHAVTGWHKLRLEGSRSECWVRAFVDGTVLAFETGSCDLSGAHVLLQGSSPYWESADVAWKDLQVMRGDSHCR